MKCSDKISIGEYVRTDNGIIGKYVKFRGWQDTIETNNKWIGFDIDKDIVKHSRDIIDLVQKDDYVNGHLVIHKYTDTYYGQVILIEKALAEAEEKFLKNKDIKSVITAEQIKQIEYRIKE